MTAFRERKKNPQNFLDLERDKQVGATKHLKCTRAFPAFKEGS